MMFEEDNSLLFSMLRKHILDQLELLEHATPSNFTILNE